MLFIVGGAFAGLEEVIEARTGKQGIGFGSAVRGKAEIEEANAIAQVLPEDLLKFGMIPEFIGRLPVITTVQKLDRTALINILTEPKNALVRQYRKLFELDGGSWSSPTTRSRPSPTRRCCAAPVPVGCAPSSRRCCSR